jgi:HSP20 family molecular chaperone IbpA
MLSGLSNMTELISHGFETRYDAPADRRSVRIRALVAAKDEETEESAPRSFITRLRAGIHDAINRWLHRLRRRTSDTQDGSEQLPLFLDTNPSIDLEEMDDGIVVLAELPGLDAKDFEIETDGRRLTLRGQKKRKARSAVAATVMPSVGLELSRGRSSSLARWMLARRARHIATGSSGSSFLKRRRQKNGG